MTAEASLPRPLLVQIFTDARLALMLALGYSSGLPILLVLSTQSAWLAKAGVDIKLIGLASYVNLAYSLKPIWAPVVDRYDPPLLARWLGRRRAWLLTSQIGVAAGLVALSFGDPAHQLWWTIVFAMFTAFAGATQDIVVDGWRIDNAPEGRQGMMSATYQLGYRLAMLCAGAGALYIADGFSWQAAYLTMTALTTIGMAACLLSPATTIRTVGPAPSLHRSFIAPFQDLFKRLGASLALIVLLVAIYRLPDFLSGVMATPLYVRLGFSLSNIATVTKLYGIWIGLAGAFGGGFAVARLGLMPTLLIGGLAASFSHVTLAWLAASGARPELLVLSVSAENFASGFAGTALIAYMSSLTSPAFAATQYALLSSLYALPGKLLGGVSGFAVERIGYPAFFLATSAIGIPVAILCVALWLRARWSAPLAGQTES